MPGKIDVVMSNKLTIPTDRFVYTGATVPFGGIKAEVEPMHAYPLMISASGDPDFPFFVCPVDGEGIEMAPIAVFVRHADALLFVEMAKVKA